MLVVMALGGSAPLRVGEPKRAEAQWWNVAVAARAVAAVAREHTVVVAHGNGLQGQLLEQALGNEMPERKVASLVIEVIARLVAVGPLYADTIDGRRFAAEFGWVVAQDGTSFRQCVPSPGPHRIVQLNSINTLIEAGVLVICACGQGIAIGEAELGPKEGEVIVDTDLAAALLGEGVGADLLMLLTAAERVEVDWRTGQRLPLLGATTVEALRRISYTGLVGPKVEAACRFVESTGRRAAIGALDSAQEILLGDRGIQVMAPRVP